MNAEGLIGAEEGRANVTYLDTRGIPTWGIGHKDLTSKVGDTWTDDQIDAAFNADYARASTGIAASLPWWDQLDEVRQAYLVSMAFQMGVQGVLEFHHTLAAIQAQQWNQAAQGIRSSDWFTQTPGRAGRCALAMLDGQWHLPE